MTKLWMLIYASTSHWRLYVIYSNVFSFIFIMYLFLSISHFSVKIKLKLNSSLGYTSHQKPSHENSNSNALGSFQQKLYVVDDSPMHVTCFLSQPNLLARRS